MRLNEFFHDVEWKHGFGEWIVECEKIDVNDLAGMGLSPGVYRSEEGTTILLGRSRTTSSFYSMVSYPVSQPSIMFSRPAPTRKDFFGNDINALIQMCLVEVYIHDRPAFELYTTPLFKSADDLETEVGTFKGLENNGLVRVYTKNIGSVPSTLILFPNHTRYILDLQDAAWFDPFRQNTPNRLGTLWFEGASVDEVLQKLQKWVRDQRHLVLQMGQVLDRLNLSSESRKSWHNRL